jgi:hypothetical protein
VRLNGVVGRRLSLTMRVAYRSFCHPAEKVVIARRKAELDAIVRQDDVDLAEQDCEAASKWELIAQIAVQWLPPVRMQHPYPQRRFIVKHPRWEPSALAAALEFVWGRGGPASPLLSAPR